MLQKSINLENYCTDSQERPSQPRMRTILTSYQSYIFLANDPKTRYYIEKALRSAHLYMFKGLGYTTVKCRYNAD